MSQPTASDVHVDTALTNVSVAYLQDEKNFIASQVFPVVPVEHRSDVYYTYTKADWRRNLSGPRAPGSESKGGGFGVSNTQYLCTTQAYHKDIDDQTRANADSVFNLERDATEFVTQQLLIGKEIDWGTNYFATGKWGTDKVGGTDFTVWSDGSSDPEKDTDDGKKTILTNTGFWPNKLVVGLAVHQALKRHPLVQERFKYTSSDSITEEMLARYFEIDTYLVARASYDSSTEGATSSNAMILGSHALLTYAPSAPSLLKPSGGYTFAWRGLTGLNNAAIRVKNFRMEHLESDRIEGEYAYVHKLVASDVGYFFSGAA